MLDQANKLRQVSFYIILFAIVLNEYILIAHCLVFGISR